MELVPHVKFISYGVRYHSINWKFLLAKIGNVQITQGNLYSVLKLDAMVYKGRVL